MANEVKTCFTTGRTLRAYTYYDNAGTMTVRMQNGGADEYVAMTEEPASSGVYKASPVGITTGDIIKIVDVASALIIATGIYQERTKLVDGSITASSYDNTTCFPKNEMIY